MDVRVSIKAWSVETDEDRFRENARNAFELGLRRDGVIVDPDAPNYLFCSIQIAESGELVAYTFIH